MRCVTAFLPHQVGVADLLDATRLIDSYPASVTLLELVPDVIDLAVVQSKTVDNKVEELVAAIVDEVETLGYRMVREQRSADANRPIHNLTRYFGSEGGAMRACRTAGVARG